MKKFRVILLLIVILHLTFCSGKQSVKEQINAESKEQVKIENKGINNPLYNKAYRLYYEKKYKQGYNLLKQYVFNDNGKSLVLHSLLVKFANKLNAQDTLLKQYLNLNEQKFYVFASAVRLVLAEKQITRNLGTFKELSMSVNMFPGNPVVLMYLGYLYILKNRSYLAVSILKESVSTLDKFPFSRFYLAIAYYHSDNKKESIESLNNAISLFPSYMQVEINSAQKLKKRISS